MSMTAIKVAPENYDAILGSSTFVGEVGMQIMMENAEQHPQFFIANFRRPDEESVPGNWALWPVEQFFEDFHVSDTEKINTSFVEITHK